MSASSMNAASLPAGAGLEEGLRRSNSPMRTWCSDSPCGREGERCPKRRSFGTTRTGDWHRASGPRTRRPCRYASANDRAVDNFWPQARLPTARETLSPSPHRLSTEAVTATGDKWAMPAQGRDRISSQPCLDAGNPLRLPWTGQDAPSREGTEQRRDTRPGYPTHPPEKSKACGADGPQIKSTAREKSCTST